MTNLHAEIIIRNGTIRTMDVHHPTAEAVAIANGRILAVGSLEDVEGTAHTNTRRIDLGGRTLIPGFNDAYLHLYRAGRILTSTVDVQHVSPSTITAITDLLRARGEKLPPDAWIIGSGYSELALAEKRHPTRNDLDLVSTQHPIMLAHIGNHTVAVNSLALKLAQIYVETEDPAGGKIERDEQGQPTGVLHETAMGLVTRIQPEPTRADFETAVNAAARAYLRLGITSVTEAGSDPIRLDFYRKLAMERRMPFRVNAQARRYADDGSKLPLPERYEGHWLRIDTVKLSADGGLTSGQAALSEPYQYAPGHTGVLRADEEKMRSMIWDVHRAGLRASIHAVGNAAIEQVISAIEYASRRLVSRIHHRIDHFALPMPDHMRRCQGRIGVVPQPVFIRDLGPTILEYLSYDVANQAYPVRSMVKAGLTIGLSSGAPVSSDPNPLLGIKAAADRQLADGRILNNGQGIAVLEGLMLYTLGSAAVNGEDHLKGSITPGKYADLAVLSGDPLRAPIERLTDLKIEMTIVDGQILYSS